jgi:putative transposase
MALLDRQYLKTPFYGSRRMSVWLRRQGHQVNRKRVRRLIGLMGLEAIFRRPNTSKAAAEHGVYPHLLRGLEISRGNQVWAADITYIPIARGFLYLVRLRRIMDPDIVGTATCWSGVYPTPWMLTFASRPWRRR